MEQRRRRTFFSRFDLAVIGPFDFDDGIRLSKTDDPRSDNQPTRETRVDGRTPPPPPPFGRDGPFFIRFRLSRLALCSYYARATTVRVRRVRTRPRTFDYAARSSGRRICRRSRLSSSGRAIIIAVTRRVVRVRFALLVVELSAYIR